MNSRLINSVAVILDPITTLFSVLFVSLFVKTFGLEQYGYFILLIAWFSLALNNSWGFDNAARSLLSQAHTGDQKLESLYLVCIYTAIAASGLFIIINRVTGYFDYYETLFILSAFAQLTTAIAGPIYLQNDNIIAERVLYSTFNNINFLSLLLCLTISNEINTFFALRFGLILTAVTAIHFLFCRKIFQKNVVSNAHKELFSTIIKVSKYSINNLSAGVIWQLNPLILSTVATPNMIAAFSLYFRIAGLIISCQGYIFSWSVVHLKNNVMASSTQKVLAIIKIYTVVVPIALTSFVFYLSTSKRQTL